MTRRLTILSVAYPLAPVGPDAVGGAEQVLASLDRWLVAHGHRSIVIAQQGSAVAGELVAIAPPAGLFDDDARDGAHAAVRAAIASCIGTVDVVHLHGIDFAEYMPPPGPPVLVTLHLPVGWYRDLTPTRPNTFLHCVSAHQHATCGGHVLAPIANGVDVAALGAVRPARDNYAVMLGRICPEKGQHLALQAAHSAGVTLAIAGVAYPYPAHEAYLAERVRPLLDARRRLIGAVGFERKRVLLAGARCLLAPSLAPETSSLVAMEALACGTPVVAFRAGALADIVEPGVTGFLVDDVDEMADAIGRVDSIDSETCRRIAREKFDVRAGMDAYLALYERLAPVMA